MIEIQGKYNSAKIFTDNIEQEAISQVYELLNQEYVKDSKIRFMPDIHAGAGCVIGTTMEIKDKICPNLVGVDIGCGMMVAELGNIEIDYEKLEEVINTYIPSGINVHENRTIAYCGDLLDRLKCRHHINGTRASQSIGTLGGGNHFIEIDVDEDGCKYLIVHTGSRHLGKEICKYYQDLAYKNLNSNKEEIKALIAQLKAKGRHKEIEAEIQKMKAIKVPKVSKSLAYLEGEAMNDYLHDVECASYFAHENRFHIIREVCHHMGWKMVSIFETVHNYIDINQMILRKSSVSARNGEKLIIPMNMRDGSLICIGKGNVDWNYSAPHGAGRIMSRSKAKEMLSMEEFEASMEGINTYSVCESTIDEAPMVYKPMEEIIENIQDTVEIQKIIKPVYNFKAKN